ncbi:MAG: Fic family protein [Bacteroidales bacterium]|nr:Fic family protein [Bacteroidales bacterium]
MGYIEDFNKAFDLYKKKKIFIPDQEEEKVVFEYVYNSNKLEGNKLNLIQTTKLLTQNIAAGDLPLKDYLEAKGHYKALKFILTTGHNKYPLTERILKKANELILGPLWAIEDSYPNWKVNNQELGKYKVLNNKIQWEYNNDTGEISPFSDNNNIEKNINNIITEFNNSKSHILEKVSFLAYNIFIHQPFPDGNKRTARLLTSYATIKEGLPLIPFNIQKKTNFNDALLQTYFNKDKTIITKFLAIEFTTKLYQLIERNKKLKKTDNNDFIYLI